jgi:hypothetical protein
VQSSFPKVRSGPGGVRPETRREVVVWRRVPLTFGKLTAIMPEIHHSAVKRALGFGQ